MSLESGNQNSRMRLQETLFIPFRCSITVLLYGIHFTPSSLVCVLFLASLSYKMYNYLISMIYPIFNSSNIQWWSTHYTITRNLFFFFSLLKLTLFLLRCKRFCLSQYGLLFRDILFFKTFKPSSFFISHLNSWFLWI